MSNVATAAALLALANEAITLSIKLQKVSAMISQAQIEGRDITQEELDGIIANMNQSVDAAIKALNPDGARDV